MGCGTSSRCSLDKLHGHGWRRDCRIRSVAYAAGIEARQSMQHVTQPHFMQLRRRQEFLSTERMLTSGLLYQHGCPLLVMELSMMSSATKKKACSCMRMSIITLTAPSQRKTCTPHQEKRLQLQQNAGCVAQNDSTPAKVVPGCCG